MLPVGNITGNHMDFPLYVDDTQLYICGAPSLSYISEATGPLIKVWMTHNILAPKF